MATYEIFKETALPSTLVRNGIYFIGSADPNYVELYVTDNAGVATRRIPTIADINTLINSSVANLNSLEVVADITARDALAPTSNIQVLVLDATSDPAVDSGAATYVYDFNNTTWVKTSEAESMDITLGWADIVGRPVSSPAQIDSAVTNSHTHPNITELGKISEDGDGDMRYDGVNVVKVGSISW